MKYRYLPFLFLFIIPIIGNTQHSVARQWNEELLHAIRNDFARPTVHARNLFHTSVLMYDAWAAFDETADTYFLGKTVNGFTCPFDGIARNNIQNQRETAISYAMYRLLTHRFRNSPGAEETLPALDEKFHSLGYDTAFHATDYVNGNAAALGNYLAENMIEFGLQDGSNEQNDYVNQYYRSFNFPLAPELSTNPFLWDPNRWQPLTFEIFIDQSGNEIPGGAPEFLSPEWGIVTPFALKETDLTIHEREGNEYWVYHDPTAPPYIDEDNGGGDYQWGFSMVSLWSSHLDPADGVMWDISPASLGNVPVEELPTTFEEYRDFYQPFDGGDTGQGYDINPHTGQPYEPQIVPRGDYTRVLAEFWADGPDSETPPGHWFTVLNYVHDHPQFERRFKGKGEIMDDLEWNVKAYLILGGAMHDAAVSSWGIKGWYDYLRPISAIRYMGEKGQSTDPNLPNYHPAGLPLQEGFIELVQEGDPLAGDNNENVGKVKLYAWKGPDFIANPETDIAGVGWVLSNKWWPYQRPTFVTPPFAGFISGHSTFSRAAAEVLTKLTGDPYFPGGLGEFVAKKNEFLVFEEGPSQDIVLQWATYQDASDQTSLSRIWGGIHPPADDIPGRFIGIEIAEDAFNLAEQYFNDISTSTEEITDNSAFKLYPNPVLGNESIIIEGDFNNEKINLEVFDYTGKLVHSKTVNSYENRLITSLGEQSLPTGFYLARLKAEHLNVTYKIQVVQK